MDSHPIPQDVTGFQFKLIGEMTVKQFAYVASGIILAWIFFSLPLSAFLKVPFAIFFIISGLSLAFAPLEGRPLDVMVINFLKAFFTPNQYVFQKEGIVLFPVVSAQKKLHDSSQKAPTISAQELQALFVTTATVSKNPLDQKEALFFQSVSSLLTNKPTSASQPTPPPPQPEEQKETVSQIAKDQVTQEEEPVSKANERVLELERLLKESLDQKKRLEEQLLALGQQVIRQSQQSTYKPLAVKKESQAVKNPGIPIGFDVPNLILGTVKDPRGNVLPNILIEIKDHEGNPIRAFKTNKLGQFASATSLLNGTYTILFEDPSGNHKFDTLELTADGKIIPALEVRSQDARDELRKALFQK